MYGTIARIHPLPDKIEDLVAYGERMRGLDVPGFRATFLFRPDENPYDEDTVFLIALFDDKASYDANASSPAQNERYLEMRALLADDPDWMDGTFDAVFGS